MGRKRSRFHLLPPKMVARQRGKTVYYYFDQRPARPAELPLGKDYSAAVRKWAELVGDLHSVPKIVTFRHAAERYQREVMPQKAERTQRDNALELVKLLEFFDNPPSPLSSLKPIHVRQYLDWRTRGGKGYTRADREKALFSHIWNKARSWGLTDAPNPCLGIEGFHRGGRDVYVEDDVYRAVWDKASQPLRDAMDLAYLTGQRPADTLRFDERDVRDGQLHLRQSKTGTKRRIAVEGELKDLLDRIAARKAEYVVRSTRLVVTESGTPLSASGLRSRFDTARNNAGVAKADFQFRDLRAKAGTDKAESSGDIRQAQKQLGHSSVTMTEAYVRNRRGDKVTPTR